jgi:ribosomal protein L37AE/L43A
MVVTIQVTCENCEIKYLAKLDSKTHECPECKWTQDNEYLD